MNFGRNARSSRLSDAASRSSSGEAGGSGIAAPTKSPKRAGKHNPIRDDVLALLESGRDRRWTVRDLCAAVPARPTDTAVRKCLRRLHREGLARIDFRQAGKAHEMLASARPTTPAPAAPTPAPKPRFNPLTNHVKATLKSDPGRRWSCEDIVDAARDPKPTKERVRKCLWRINGEGAASLGYQVGRKGQEIVAWLPKPGEPVERPSRNRAASSAPSAPPVRTVKPSGPKLDGLKPVKAGVFLLHGKVDARWARLAKRWVRGVVESAKAIEVPVWEGGE